TRQWLAPIPDERAPQSLSAVPSRSQESRVLRRLAPDPALHSPSPRIGAISLVRLKWWRNRSAFGSATSRPSASQEVRSAVQPSRDRRSAHERHSISCPCARRQERSARRPTAKLLVLCSL